MDRGNLARREPTNTASINAMVEKNTCWILSSTPTLMIWERVGRALEIPGVTSIPPLSPWLTRLTGE